MVAIESQRKEVISSTTLCTCARCGAPTDWEDDLGPEPLCASCWDELDADVSRYVPYETVDRSRSERDIAEKKRAYYEAHRDDIAEKQRAYYEAHRDDIAEKKRAYYEAHRDDIAEKQRAYGLVGKRRRFTVFEDQWIVEWRAEGMTFREIASRLARDQAVVYRRYQGLIAHQAVSQ